MKQSLPKNNRGSFHILNCFDQMDAKKSKRRSVFTFAPTKTPKELAAYLTNLLRQNKMTDESDNCFDRSLKRALRVALRSQDVHKLDMLMKQGVDVNEMVDNVFWETPLMYAVKHTQLEIVERLLTNWNCHIDIDVHDRNGHTALDEAIRIWLTRGANTESKQHRGRRFRVLRCIVAAGAAEYSDSFLDNIFYYCHNSKSSVAAVDKLVKLACQKGAPKLKTGLLSNLLSHGKMSKSLQYLLTSGADPASLAMTVFTCQHIPEENAIVVIKATNDDEILHKMEQYLRIPRSTSDHRLLTMPINLPARHAIGSVKLREAIRLLLLSSHALNPQTMHYLRRNHASLYRMAASFIREPRPLKYLARVIVRKQCSPNVFAAIKHLRGVPLSIKAFLVFEDEDTDLRYSH